MLLSYKVYLFFLLAQNRACNFSVDLSGAIRHSM